MHTTKVVRPFKIDDVKNLRPHDQKLLKIAGFADDNSPSYSGFVDDEYAFSAGIVESLGVGTVWVLTTPLVEKYPLWFSKAVRNMLNAGTDLYKLQRVQATVLKENKKAVKWIEFLGFEREGLMRKYVGGDHYLYARIS